MPVRIELRESMFGEAERPLCAMGEFRASTFRYPSGVAALRLANARGHLDVLPFRGQQIWRAVFDGRDLSMKSMFNEPVDTNVYLETYGAFFIHCGLTGMGAPGPTDHHPLHGELPAAKFQTAWLECDEAAGVATIGGAFRYGLAFSAHYLATASIALPAGSTLFDVALKVENLKRSPMELMYLGHANFRPVDGGEIVYSAPYTPKAVRVRQAIPAHIAPKPGYREFIAALAKDPTVHHRLKPGLAFDPEVAFTVDMTPDAEGFAHAMQVRPDGSADYIRYRPDEAGKCIRWICRTGDQDALGIALPATAETEGYMAEKAKGNVVTLPAGGHWGLTMRMGALDAKHAKALAKRLQSR